MTYSIITNTYVHQQTTASDTWTITHNLQKTAPIIDCWIDNNGDVLRILPNTTTVIDENTIEVTFTDAWAGSANIV
jgi:hypothetical protein